jgi:abhydrolase domain-containing protein 1/3
MQRLAMDLRVLSRELALYLEHQVRVGFFGSGVGLSLILGFSVAYACYYLSSIAKVSWGRGQWSVAGPGDPRLRRRP